jgi:CRP-like cAMP-binding protein
MVIALSSAYRDHGIRPDRGIRAQNRSQQSRQSPLTLGDHMDELLDHGVEMRFDRGESVFNQDEPAEYVYRLAGGAVRLCRYMPDGRRYILDFALPGDLLGFGENPDLAACAEAVTDVVLIAFPRSCVDQLARENGAVRRQLFCHLSANLLTAQHHLFVLGCQKAKERLASFLLRLADRMGLKEGDRFNLPMSRQDIAEHLGLSIETVSRMMSALRDDGIILIPHAHQIVMRDVAALRTLAAED